MQLEKLFEMAKRHREEHGCSAYPYESYQKLFDAVAKINPHNILEIGTGCGFSATVMALAASSCHVDTIEKDTLHTVVARNFLKDAGCLPQVKIINDIAEIVLPELPGPYDLIFFDGFQIHYEFLPHYKKLLRPGGILFLANTYLTSKTSAQFFEELNNSGDWQTTEQFLDTIIVKKV